MRKRIPIVLGPADGALVGALSRLTGRPLPIARLPDEAVLATARLRGEELLRAGVARILAGGATRASVRRQGLGRFLAPEPLPVAHPIRLRPGSARRKRA